MLAEHYPYAFAYEQKHASASVVLVQTIDASGNISGGSTGISGSLNTTRVATTNKTILFSDSGSNPLSVNTSRIQWSLQNFNTESLYVKFGTGCNSASLGQYDMILGGCISLDDGTGAKYEDGLGNSVWGGAVSVTSSTSIRYVCTEKY